MRLFFRVDEDEDNGLLFTVLVWQTRNHMTTERRKFHNYLVRFTHPVLLCSIIDTKTEDPNRPSGSDKNGGFRSIPALL